MSSKSFLGAASQFFGFTSRRPANDVVSLSAEGLPLVPVQIAAQQNAVAVNPPAVPLPLCPVPSTPPAEADRLRNIERLRAELAQALASPEESLFLHSPPISSIADSDFDAQQQEADIQYARINASNLRDAGLTAQLAEERTARLHIQAQLQAQQVQIQALTHISGHPNPSSTRTVAHGEMEPVENLLRTLLIDKRQKDVPHPVLRSTDTLALCTFLSQVDAKGPCPLHEYIDRKIHLSLLHLLRRPETTMADAYFFDVGPQQPLLIDLFRLAQSRTDIDADTFLASFRMSPGKAGVVDGPAITVMTTATKLFYERFLVYASIDTPLVTAKKQIANNLEPAFFRDVINKKKDWWSSKSITLQEFLEYIDNKADIESAASATVAKRGLQSACVASVLTANPAVLPPPALVPRVPRVPSVTKGGYCCHNCKVVGLVHFTGDCPDVCRVHKIHCPSKNQCCRVADGFNATGPIQSVKKQVRLVTSLSSNSAATVCPSRDKYLPSDEVATDILFDTGANALCIHRLSLFTGEVDDNAAHITVAHGESVDIPGSGPVNAHMGKYIPDFEKSLVPAAVITDTSIIVIDSDGMNVIPSTPCTVENVRTLIKEAEPSLSMFIPVVNGLFPMSASQIRRVTTSASERERLVKMTNASANSSYFTVKLDGVGELVRFWHETWKHASKKDMILIVANKIFEDIPPALTITAINKYFDDHCVGCKKSTLREKSKPQESARIYRTGEGCAMDISYWSTPDFSGNTVCCHSTDLGSGYSWVDFLPSLASLDKLVHKNNSRYVDQGYLMEFIRVDKSFVTEATRSFCARRGILLEENEVVDIPAIIIEQPGPYEHAQNGSIECLIKCQVQDTNKALESAQLLDSDGERDDRYWSKAMRWVNDTRNKLPGGGQVVSRGVAWGLPKTSLLQPMMPFASRVLGHLPLKMQNNLSGRSISCLYLGPALGIKGGILLHNLATNRTICRVSFKVMGQVDRLGVPHAVTEMELSGEEGADEYIYDEETESVRTISVPDVPDSGVVSNPGVSSSPYRSVLQADLPKSQLPYFKKLRMQFIDIIARQRSACVLLIYAFVRP